MPLLIGEFAKRSGAGLPYNAELGAMALSRDLRCHSAAFCFIFARSITISTETWAT